MPATMNLISTFQIAPGKTLLTAEQAAEYLHVQMQTLANWRGTGKGPAFVRIGRLIRYRLESLDRWIDSQSSNSELETA